MNKYNLLGNYLQPLGSPGDNAFPNNDWLLQRLVIAALFRHITGGKTVYSIINICTAVPFRIIAYARFAAALFLRVHLDFNDSGGPSWTVTDDIYFGNLLCAQIHSSISLI